MFSGKKSGRPRTFQEPLRTFSRILIRTRNSLFLMLKTLDSGNLELEFLELESSNVFEVNIHVTSFRHYSAVRDGDSTSSYDH